MGLIMHCDSFEVPLRDGPDMADITGALSAIVTRSGIVDGSAQVCAIGSTGSITTIEYEPGAIEDLKRAIRRLAPPDMEYAHEMMWHDGNGHSHVQSALLGPSQVVPVRRGRLRLGTWQQVIVINHDTKPRKRTVEVTVVGNG